jgi:hypothetical protein
VSDPSPLWPTLTVAVGLIAWTTAVRLRRGAILAPFSLTLLMLVAIFGIRPLIMLQTDDYHFYGRSAAAGFNAAAFAGFSGVAALTVAYWLSRSTRPGETPGDAAAVRPPWRQPPSVPVAAWLCLAALGCWFAIMVYLGGIGFIPLLFGGRSTQVYAVLGQVPSAVFCLPLAAAAVLCVSRIQATRTRRLAPREALTFWAGIVVSGIPSTALGTRRFLLPAALMAAMAVAYPRWHVRVTMRMAAASSGMLLLLAAIPYVRSAGARTSAHPGFIGALGDYFGTAGLAGVLQASLSSNDTEGFAYVAYVAPRLGDGIPYGYGRGTVGDALANPLPARFGVGTWADHLLTVIFGQGCTTTSGGACPISSVVGVLYFDLGIGAVIAGCAVLGWLYARFDGAFLAARSYRLLLLLVLAGFAPVVARGASLNSAWLAETVFILAAGLLWLFGSKPPPADVQLGLRGQVAAADRI